MRDLTEGPVAGHLLRLAGPIAAGMVFQTLYYLIDLYFVARLGDAAIAGVGGAGNVQFIVMSLTQILGVGTMALIAQAVGRRDWTDANLVFNQSLVLSMIALVATLVGGAALARPYMERIGADAETIAAGTTYLRWFLPGLALQFAMVTASSALRGTGIVKPTMIVQVATVVINAMLAPVLIVGWGTGKPLGVAGAGLATSIAIAIGVGLLALYFVRLEKAVAFDRALLRPKLETWKRILRIGLPTGGEFALMFLYLGVVYWIIRDFGAEAQAGYGLGSRIMQAIFLPAMAVAFATAPVAGQNFGAGQYGRVRETFRSATTMGTVAMLVITLVCQWRPEWFVTGFTREAAVIAVGADFLRIISWNFVASGVVFTCSGMFQALGNTVPSLLSSASRIFLFAAPGVWLASLPGFTLRQLWYLSVVSVALQAGLSLWLLRRQFRARLGAPAASGADGVEARVVPTPSPGGADA